MYLHTKYPEKYPEKDVQSYLIDKLVPGESNVNANTEIVKIIQNSSELHFSKYFTISAPPFFVRSIILSIFS